MSSLRLPLLALSLLPALALAEPAPGPSAAETKLREALRANTTQLRQAQEELASARAALESKTAELAALAKKSKAESARLADEIAATSARLKEQTALTDKSSAKARELDTLAARWKAEAERLAASLNATDAERARLKVLSDRLTVRVADREARNTELVRIGEEILTRFEKYGLGEALAGKDAFIGTKRVALRNTVQDYVDKIAEARAAAGKPAPGELAAAPAPAR